MIGLVHVVAFQVQSVVCTGERRSSAQFHIRQFVGVGTEIQVIADSQRRVDITQTLENILVTYPFQLILSDGHCSSGITLCLTGENTGNDHFLHFCHILFQYYFQSRFSFVFDVFILHTDKRELEDDFRLFRYGDFKFPVHVGSSSQGSTF